jgi:dTDP-glucose 4,6-dehydratase
MTMHDPRPELPAMSTSGVDGRVLAPERPDIRRMWASGADGDDSEGGHPTLGPRPAAGVVPKPRRSGERQFHSLLVTGGAGFIGSAFVRNMLRADPEVRITILDKLTYAGNPANLAPCEADPAQAGRCRLIVGDIADADEVVPLVAGADAIVNFAAESHVDRSIHDPGAFLRTGVLGVHTLLEAARHADHPVRYLQVSTDEVYGDIPEGASTEDDPLRPRSPYAAAKAAGDHLVRSYVVTYGLDAVITRGSNTYGPYQFPEKVIPLFVTNAIDGQALPLYGDGRQVRDWIYVDDHASGIDLVLRRGEPGGVYNIPGAAALTNLDLTRRILAQLGRPEGLIRHVADRPGHDRRYRMDGARIEALGWSAQLPMEEGLPSTVAWYLEHEDWWRPLKSGEWHGYYARQYAARLAGSTPHEPEGPGGGTGVPGEAGSPDDGSDMPDGPRGPDAPAPGGSGPSGRSRS